MDSTIGDFVRQVPIQILLMPIVLGILYIGVMINIMSRARKRRQAKLAAQMGQGMEGQSIQPAQPKPEPGYGIRNFLRGELPNRPMQPAEWTVLPELRGMPEPDLDMLTTPSLDALVGEAQPIPPSPAAYQAEMPVPPATNPITVKPETSTVSAAPTSAEPDWLSVLTPQPESEQETGDTGASTPEVPVSTPYMFAPSAVQQENPAMTASNTVPSGNTLPADAVEVMRIYRDMNDGRLIVQMGNGTYRTLNDINNPDLARRFTTVVRDLWAMINGGASSGTGTYNAANTTLAAPTTTIAAPDNSTGGLKSKIGLLSAEPEKPKPNIMRSFARAAMGQSSIKNDEPTGIAGAVEEFLQFKLANTPEFATRSIHIRSAEDHGIRIEVDGHYYDGIGEIVDADVREFMVNMMREWEARH